MLVSLSVGDAARSRTKDVRRGVIVRHGAQADVVKRISRRLFEAEQDRR